MAPIFPTILIGGPPHSGKSTLTYRLSRALLNQQVQHYVLRASPDGEGNWSSEAPAGVVAELRLRAKSDWTPQFAEKMSRDIAHRHLPLLVDAGGKPSPETERIAAQCTHTVLLAAHPPDLDPWRSLVARQGLVLLADLQSDLDAPQHLVSETPVLRGVISGLSRTGSSAGVCFDTLVQRLARICAYDAQELYQSHLALTSIELVIHVERAIYPLPAHTDDRRWFPAELPQVLESLPAGEELGIYGRGPVWLYAALAALAYPAPCAVFDVRQGWVSPPPLKLDTRDDPSRLRWDRVREDATHTHVQLSLSDSYLDYRDATNLPVPIVPIGQGVIFDGRLPNWLWAALSRTYLSHPWLAVYHPQEEQAVVIWSHTDHIPVGSLYPVSAASG